VTAVVLVTDSEAAPAFQRALAERRVGFTVLPAVLGAGRSGVKAGDRVHPGGSSVILTVLDSGEAEATLEALRRARDEAGAAGATRIWRFGVDEVA
jgi:hypothetical protein